MLVSELSDSEKQVILFLADCFRQGGRWVGFSEVPGFADHPEETERVIRFLDGSVLRIDTTSSFQIEPSVLEVAQAIRNPPKPDYRKIVSAWFWSHPASVIVFVIGGVVPWIVGVIAGLKLILDWFGIAA